MTPAPAPHPERVAALFDALADLDPATADAALAAQCGGDPALRDAVGKLLAHDRAAGHGFLASPPTLLVEALAASRTDGVTLTAAESSGALAELPAASARLGRFYVLHKLGEGGMGVVYVGYDEGLDRRVALKVLRRGAAAREWLLREGQALGRLAHPNVVAIHEVSEHEGRVFLAMELVEGPTLRAFIDTAPRTFADTLRLFLDAGRGLAAAHDAGLVHRDFKPDNVLIGKDGRARVVDFGIASLAAPTGEGTTTVPSAPITEAAGPQPNALSSPLTHRGALMGTPAFMSPEQLRGERATPASDQWSFCVALYQAAYDAEPFPSAPGLLQRSLRVSSAPPIAPPRLPDVPAWLAPVLLRGLDRDPAARFPSMHELLEAIEKHVPRDAELDPAPVFHERLLLSGFFVVGCLATAGLMIFDACAQVLLRPAFLIGVPAVLLALLLSTIAIRWRRFSRNRYGRRLAVLFPAGILATIVHRVVEVVLGTPPPNILVIDTVVFAAFTGVAASLEAPWMAWLGGLAVVLAFIEASFPEHAVTLFALSGHACMIAMGIRVYFDRHVGRQSMVAEKRKTARSGSYDFRR